MSPIQVFRIEDDERKGPWTSSHRSPDGPNRFSPSMLDMNAMPTTYSDVFVGRSHRDMEAYRHGLTDRQMARWIQARDRELLRRVPEFRLSVYLCPPGTISYGEQQIVFDIVHAILTEELPL